MELPQELLYYAIDIAKGNNGFISDDYHDREIESIKKKIAELNERLQEVEGHKKEKHERQQRMREFLKSIGQEIVEDEPRNP